MKINAIQNNGYNSNFGSKFKFAAVGLIPRENGLKSALEYGRNHEDRTFLNAMKGLLTDGLNDVYTYVTSNETGNWLLIHDAQKGVYTHLSLLDNITTSAELFRDYMVNLAREKGLISGKAVSSAEIAKIYEPYRYDSLFHEEINNKMKDIGFQKFSPKTKEDKEAIRSCIKDELKKIKEADSSNVPNKLKIIQNLRDEIYQKTYCYLQN